MTLVLLASLAQGSSVTQINLPVKPSVASASVPCGDRCGSQHAAFHDHALCCSAASCSPFVAVDVVCEFAPEPGAKAVAAPDLNFSSQALPALFHPPKLLAIA